MRNIENAVRRALQNASSNPDKIVDDDVNLVVNALKKNKIIIPEHGNWHVKWGVERYNTQEDKDNGVVYTPEEARKYFGAEQFTEDKLTPEQTSEFMGNLLLNGGITVLLNLITTTGSSPLAWSSANAHLGVGDSSTAEAASQSALQASTNKLFIDMDATYPQVANQTATWQATFTGNQANWHWYEFGVANSDAGTILLNRKVSDQGTKTSGQIWTCILTVTIS